MRVFGGVTVDLDGLFRDHATPLLRLGVVLTGDRALAEELVQEAFVRFSQSRSTPAPGAERTYLRRIVVNLSHAHHRHLRVVRGRRPDAPGTAAPAEQEAIRRDGERVVAEAVRALPDRQRDCVVLRYYLDLPVDEIAATLGLSRNSVKTHLTRGLRNLSAQLGELR